jgi:putative secretion ATPase (PEP-CTERM system associated)
MYEAFYELSGPPFQLTPDSRFYFESTAHARAVAHLTFGLAQGEGFVVVTGEVGAGKTTLIEHVLGQISRETYAVARINTTQVSGDDLFRLAMAGYGIDAPGADKATLLLRFEEVLSDHRLSGRRCLLIVDEVQNLSLAALEELRMLSNITEGGRASLQTILLGQPQFRRMLATQDLDQLRQRVLASYHLGPLTREETRAYILHRLGTVGWHGRPRWNDDAFAAVFAHSGGLPRRINRLCSRVLLYGALEEADEITRAMVETTAEELAQDLEGGRPAAAVDGHAGAAPALPPNASPQAGFGRAELLTQELARLSSDLHAELHAEIDRESTAVAELRQRLDALEQRVARRDRVFQRLLDALSASGVTQR